MDPYNNPFAPGAGSRPPELSGRSDILSQAELACRRSVAGKHARCMMLLGLRGTGKTVLLNEINNIGTKTGLLTSKIEAPEGEELSRMIFPQMHRVMRSLSGVESAKHLALEGLRGLRSFSSVFNIEVAGFGIGVEAEPGIADSGDIEYDLPDMFERIGLAAQAAGKGWLLLIDEVQYLSEKDLSALIVSLHRVSQLRLPIIFVGAGLPQVAKLAGNAKSYAERLFSYPEVSALEPKAAEEAIEKPVKSEGADITIEALREMCGVAQGYPFYLQEWGSQVWDVAEGPTIELEDVKSSHSGTLMSLDQGFFKVRIDRLTRAESAFVLAMANLGNGPYQIADIANSLGKDISSVGPARANIIKKGMIYSTEHGYLDFTVPLFADYLRRSIQNSAPASST